MGPTTNNWDYGDLGANVQVQVQWTETAAEQNPGTFCK